jgi:hypothetical protein
VTPAAETTAGRTPVAHRGRCQGGARRAIAVMMSQALPRIQPAATSRG